MKQRNYKIDNIKGIMIILVIFGHCIGQISAIDAGTTWLKYIYRFVYSFHMPVFVFISGYFSSVKNINKAISKYLIPYLLANALFGLLGAAVNSQLSLSEVTDPFSPNWTFWYLLSMFFWKVFLSSVLEWKYPVLTMIIAALITGVFSADYYLTLARTIGFFPYFIGGYLVGKKNISNVLKNHFSKSKAIILFIIIEVAVAYTSYKNINALSFQLCCSYQSMSQSIPMGMLLRLFSYIAGTAGIIFFFSIIPNKESYLSEIGKYSITAYLAHSFFLKLISIFVQFHSPAYIFLTSIFLAVIISVVFGNKIVFTIYQSVMSGITRFLMKENRQDL